MTTTTASAPLEVVQLELCNQGGPAISSRALHACERKWVWTAHFCKIWWVRLELYQAHSLVTRMQLAVACFTSELPRF